mmetsp:Transcript_32071/g.75622  ORF Transcript_32071/g.75622 Transcript_32071/m.75622 type:complete len:273 (-) Transcript_32071:319-1137(-)
MTQARRQQSSRRVRMGTTQLRCRSSRPSKHASSKWICSCRPSRLERCREAAMLSARASGAQTGATPTATATSRARPSSARQQGVMPSAPPRARALTTTLASARRTERSLRVSVLKQACLALPAFPIAAAAGKTTRQPSSRALPGARMNWKAHVPRLPGASITTPGRVHSTESCLSKSARWLSFASPALRTAAAPTPQEQPKRRRSRAPGLRSRCRRRWRECRLLSSWRTLEGSGRRWPRCMQGRWLTTWWWTRLRSRTWRRRGGGGGCWPTV